jgi:hypothetical protein
MVDKNGQGFTYKEFCLCKLCDFGDKDSNSIIIKLDLWSPGTSLFPIVTSNS